MAATVIPGNAQGLGRRSEQQDAFGFSDLSDPAFCAHSGALCVVCDGMGGHAAGAQAATTAVNHFLSAYCGRDPHATIPHSLQTALHAANDAVLRVAAEAGESGSTLLAAVIHRGLLRWISVGDSRLLLLRDGRLHRVNREHRYRCEQWRALADRGLPCDEALRDPRGDLLTSSLGEKAPGKIDRSLRPIALQAGDQIYLATDGLYRVVDTASLLEAAVPPAPQGAGGPALSPDAVCAAWLGRALAQDRSDQDNITVAGMAWHTDDAPTSRPVAPPASSAPTRIRRATAPGVVASQPAPGQAAGSRLDRPVGEGLPPTRRAAVLAALVVLGGVVFVSVSNHTDPDRDAPGAGPEPQGAGILEPEAPGGPVTVKGEVWEAPPASSATRATTRAAASEPTAAASTTGTTAVDPAALQASTPAPRPATGLQ